MKKALLITLIAIPLGWAAAQSKESPAAVLELEKKRASAIEAFDETFLANLYDESFSGVSASGATLQKSDQLLAFRSRNKFVLFTNEDVVANVYGSTAIVTGKQVTKSKAGSTLGLTRYLLIYLKMRDQWKIVMSQETVVITN